jgi:TctA family transporter
MHVLMGTVFSNLPGLGRKDGIGLCAYCRLHVLMGTVFSNLPGLDHKDDVGRSLIETGSSQRVSSFQARTC